MNFVRLLPVIFSFLFLAAHFSRSGLTILMIIFFVIPFLLFFRKTWIARLIQIVLWLGAIEWIRTLYIYASERDENGESWIRLAFILGGVAIFTGMSALVFRFDSLRKRYKLG